jgi:hypothetical protein
MKTHSTRGPLLPSLIVGAAMAAAATNSLALKVDMYAIGNWSAGNCSPGDTDSNRGSWPGMAQAWYDRMGAMGHSKTGKFVDGNMTPQRFCDPSTDPQCLDTSYVDWPDAAIVAAHGYNANNGWGAWMRNSWKGNCSAIAGGTTPNMFVGDKNLKFLHASSCLSLNDTYFADMRQAFKKSGATKGLHVMTGFHGLMWISSSFNGNYSNMAFDGHITSVANAWVQNHHKSNSLGCASYDPFNFFGTCQDQCPTAMTVGPTANSALTRLLNERYNNSAAFGSPSGRSYYAWMGYGGCDPVGENTFNP